MGMEDLQPLFSAFSFCMDSVFALPSFDCPHCNLRTVFKFALAGSSRNSFAAWALVSLTSSLFFFRRDFLHWRQMSKAVFSYQAGQVHLII